MARIKRGTTVRRRHKKVLKLTKGYRMTKRRLIKVAHEALLHAGEYAFMGRKRKKRDFRRLWISRISQALIPYEIKYNQFIMGLKKAGIGLNRKILAHLIVNDPNAFKEIVNKVKANIKK